MARPRSDDKRNAIMAAAVKVIAAQGLGAPTAAIAKEAGVSNGSLFTYFETKAELLNQLYVELKTEMASASLDGLPAEADVREQLRHVWTGWLHWAASSSEKRKTLAHLGVSDEVTDASRQAARRSQAETVALLERSRANGPLRDAPLMFVASLMTGLAEATIDFMAHDRAHAETHAAVAFEALWRMVA